MTQMIETNSLSQETIDYITHGLQQQSLMKLYNASVGQLKPGFMELLIPKQDALIRKEGFFFGGVTATAIDTAAFWAIMTMNNPKDYFVTVELKVNYLSPAVGNTLITTSEVVKNGKSLIVCKADSYTETNNERKLVATALVTLMRVTLQ